MQQLIVVKIRLRFVSCLPPIMILSEEFKSRMRINLLIKRSLQLINKTRHDPIRCLKPKQVDCVLHSFSQQHAASPSASSGDSQVRKDLLSVLPTGYGKTLVFQLLPVFHLLLTEAEASVAIIISPLNAIIMQQKQMLGNKATLIRKEMTIEDGHAEVLSSGTDTDSGGDQESISSLGRSRSPSPVRSLQEDDSGDDDGGSSSGESTDSDVSSDAKDESGPGFMYYLGHPEDFLEDRTMKNMAKAPWTKKVSHIFIDEAHCVVTWSKDFRPKYRDLDRLRAIFPDAALVAVTATATKRMQEEICRILAMKKVSIISSIVDRPNIKYIVKTRPPQSGRNASAEQSYNSVFLPYLHELKAKQGMFPKTVIYTGLKWCGVGSEVGVNLLTDGNITSEGTSEMAQFHAPLTAKVKEDIARSMTEEASPLRLLFATDAYGMGVDCQNIRRVVHAGPPRSLEDYSQQTGRAGRDGAPAEAIMYVNGADLGRVTTRPEIKEFCLLESCRRQYLAEHFGTSIEVGLGGARHAHLCCDICSKVCNCDACLTTAVEDVHVTDEEEVNREKQVALYNALAQYFSAVNACYLPSTIDPALMTGLTNELAEDISNNFHRLQARDVFQVAYGHIFSDFLSTIYTIIQEIDELVF